MPACAANVSNNNRNSNKPPEKSMILGLRTVIYPVAGIADATA